MAIVVEDILDSLRNFDMDQLMDVGVCRHLGRGIFSACHKLAK
jgi:hypothetical protein